MFLRRSIVSRLSGALFLLILSADPAVCGGGKTADDTLAGIVDRLETRAKERARILGNYRSLRTYRVSNERADFRREYPITMELFWPSGKQYRLPDPPPTGIVFKMAFQRLLDSEVDNARPGIQQASAITRHNYQFVLKGREVIDGEPCWVLALKPRRDSKFLLEGRIWVSCADAEIVRLEGQPAKMPSFWVKDIRLVRTFRKVNGFWLPSADRSVNQVRIFGETRFEIDYRQYEFGGNLAEPARVSQTPAETRTGPPAGDSPSPRRP
jgi:hypothetical protein